MDLVEKVEKFVSDEIPNVPVPEATVGGVHLKGVSLDSITYQVNVSVKNPYPVPIPICEISYVLKSDGRVIATGTIPDPGSLKGDGTTLLEVPAKVPHSALLSLARDVSRDWDIDYEVDIGLIIDLPVIGNFTIPLSHKGEIKLPTFADLFTGGGKKTKEDEEKRDKVVSKEPASTVILKHNI